MIPNVCENIINLQLLVLEISYLEVLENMKPRKIHICDFFHGQALINFRYSVPSASQIRYVCANYWCYIEENGLKMPRRQ